MSRTFRLALLNIQSGIGTTRGYWQYLTTHWRYMFPHASGKIEELGDFLKENKVDFFCGAEMDDGSWRTKGLSHVDILAERAGLIHRRFFQTFAVRSRINQGNAILSRYPITSWDYHPLPGTGEPRSLGEVTIDVGGRRIALFMTHLSLIQRLRRSQIHKIAEVVDSYPYPCLLAGDFNVTHHQEVRLLEESRLQKVISGETFPSWAPSRQLDFVFMSPEFSSVRARVIEKRFSDHLMLMVDVRIG